MPGTHFDSCGLVLIQLGNSSNSELRALTSLAHHIRFRGQYLCVYVCDPLHRQEGYGVLSDTSSTVTLPDVSIRANIDINCTFSFTCTLTPEIIWILIPFSYAAFFVPFLFYPALLCPLFS